MLMIIVKTAFRHLYPEPSSFRGLLDFSLTSLNKIIDNITLYNDLWVNEWVSEGMLFNAKWAMSSGISWPEQVTGTYNKMRMISVLDQHAELRVLWC